MATSASQRITLTNTGTAPLVISGITATGDFADVTDYSVSVLAGGVCHIDVTFTPLAVGSQTGTISIASNAPGSPHVVTLGGTGVPAVLPRVSALGNQFMAAGAPIRLKSINWTGGEGTNYAPHALWARPWKSQLDQFKAMGFNCLRFQLSGDFCANPLITSTAIDPTINPDVVGLTTLAFLDLIVAYCNTIGMYIVLDHHRCFASGGTGTDGWPMAGGATGSYSQAQWITHWSVLATRYASSTVVIGADVHNEPYAIEWAYWAPMVEACGNAILAIAPNWLIFVEGDTNWTGAAYYPPATLTSDSIWWGGQLIGAQPSNRPIVLSSPNHVVYAPHEYGTSVSSQTWLATSSSAPTGWPNNLQPMWRQHWGWAFEQNIAPIWVGEFGGQFGFANATGAANGNANAPTEIVWLQTLMKYLNGDWNGDGTNHLTGSQLGMSFAYWNDMLSSDTGSLVIDNDLTTPQSGKLALLTPLIP